MGINKCEHSGPRGMCHYDAEEGSHYCHRHGDEKKRIMEYRLSDPSLQEKYAFHAKGELGSVRGEVALLRAMLEERLNLARNDAEKIVAWRDLQQGLSNLDKLVNSLIKLERFTSNHIDKEALHRLAREIVTILSEELPAFETKDTVVAVIAKRIAKAVMELRNAEE